MGSGVKLISREIIKPSSETPRHLKNLKLSYLDQLAPPVYFPFIFFYRADESTGLSASNHVRISHHLKLSLSHTLPSFYPFAGRIKDNRIVDCNDEGVVFVVARVHHAQIIDVIRDSNSEELRQYLPMDPTNSSGERALLLVQISFFDCGGIAIGLCFSHQIADCTSVMAFMNAWSGKLRGECDGISRFSFDLSNYFPPGDFQRSRIFPKFPVSNEDFRTERFVFDKEKLQFLKQSATSSSQSIVKDPTRVELVSAFIWKSFLKNRNLQDKKTFAAFHVVNLRPRKKLLENLFGNCTMLAFALSDGVDEFHELVGKLRSSIRKIDGDYITEGQNGDNYSSAHYKMFSGVSKGEVERCSFSSWCRFPVYEVDYGWGNPVWLCTTTLPAKNLTVLVSSRDGDGVEAWVNMNKGNLELLETQMKLLSAHVLDIDSK